MKEIIVRNDCSTPEGFHNDGMLIVLGSKKYAALCEKELKIAHRMLDIALTGKLPKLVKIAIKERNYEDDEEWIGEVQTVCRKVTEMLAQGFHAKIIINMLRCATGGGCEYSIEFQVKFEAAMAKGVRKDFWGTEHIAPLAVAEDLLYDLLENINVNNPTKEDLEKSSLYKEMVTNFQN